MDVECFLQSIQHLVCRLVCLFPYKQIAKFLSSSHLLRVLSFSLRLLSNITFLVSLVVFFIVVGAGNRRMKKSSRIFVQRNNAGYDVYLLRRYFISHLLMLTFLFSFIRMVPSRFAFPYFFFSIIHSDAYGIYNAICISTVYLSENFVVTDFFR